MGRRAITADGSDRWLSGIGIVSLGIALIELTGPTNAVVFTEHLMPVGDPAWRSTRRKNHGEQACRDADCLQNDAGVEIQAD